MTELSANEKRDLIFDSITAARLSNWIYGAEKNGFPSAMPPLSDAVDAVVFIGSRRSDTQGAAIVTKHKIHFVFRGTESVRASGGRKDWLNNLKVLRKVEWFGIKAHRGFSGAARTVLAQVGEILDMYKDRQQIEFKGHSLGGAIAVAIAVAIVNEFRKLKDQRRVRIITLGQPRFSTRRQLSLALQFVPYVRVQNGSDIVPGIPALTYSHSGLNLYIPNNPIDRKGEASKLEDLIFFNPSAFTKFKDRMFALRDRLKDHSSRDYIDSLVRSAT